MNIRNFFLSAFVASIGLSANFSCAAESKPVNKLLPRAESGRKTIDLFGYNYKPHLYERFRQAHPDQPLYGSETASTVSSRGEYFFPVSNDKSKGSGGWFQVSSYELCGFPKDRFYLYQTRWRPELPMAHILPHWNWPNRVGKVTPVHVYTSGDEAELFLNGKSLGRRKKGEYEYRLRWDDVVYQPGELKVVTYKQGKP